MASDPSYNTNIVSEQGGSLLRVKSGGSIVADNGGVLDFSAANPTDVKLPAGIAPTLGAGAVSLPKIAFTGLVTLKGVGVAAAGPATLTGAVVGQRVLAIIGNLTAGGPLLVFVPGTDFEATISVINQIQQLSSSDLHLTTIVVILAPAES